MHRFHIHALHCYSCPGPRASSEGSDWDISGYGVSGKIIREMKLDQEEGHEGRTWKIRQCGRVSTKKGKKKKKTSPGAARMSRHAERQTDRAQVSCSVQLIQKYKEMTELNSRRTNRGAPVMQAGCLFSLRHVFGHEISFCHDTSFWSWDMFLAVKFFFWSYNVFLLGMMCFWLRHIFWSWHNFLLTIYLMTYLIYSWVYLVVTRVLVMTLVFVCDTCFSSWHVFLVVTRVFGHDMSFC